MRGRDSSRVLFSIAAFLALLVAPCHAQAHSVLLYEENFEDEQAQGWELETRWVVDAGKLNGRNHSWARYTGDSWADASVHCRLKSNGVHVNVRYSRTGRYFIGFKEQDGTLSLYLSKQLGPRFFDITTRNTRHDATKEHLVVISAIGGHIQVTVDDMLVLDYTDLDPLPAGSIAFETLDNAYAQVDDIVVYGPLPPPTPPRPAITLNPSSGNTGSEVIVMGGGFGVYGIDFPQVRLFVDERFVGTANIGRDGSFGTTFIVPFDANLGRYEVIARGPRDSASAEFSISDTTPPSISITSPAEAKTVDTEAIAVRGTASDNVALSKVELRVGGKSWQEASGTSSWSNSVTLNPGSNTIYARATDTSGNTHETSVNVTCEPFGPDWLLIAIIAILTTFVGAVILKYFHPNIKERGFDVEERGGVESPGKAESRQFEIDVEERGGVESPGKAESRQFEINVEERGGLEWL